MNGARPQIGEGIAVEIALDAVATHPGRPQPAGLVEGPGHVGIVISRHDGHILRLAERLQPEPGEIEFGVQRQVHEIAGHREMIDLCDLDRL